MITTGVHASLYGDPVANSTMGLLTSVSQEDNSTTEETSIVIEKRKFGYHKRI